MKLPNPFSHIKRFQNTTFQKLFSLATFCLCGIGILTYAYQNYCSPIVTSSKVGDRHLPIYCVDCGSEKKIALTFDAAWGNQDSAQILEILAKHDVKVTFFMTGGWVES